MKISDKDAAKMAIGVPVAICAAGVLAIIAFPSLLAPSSQPRDIPQTLDSGSVYQDALSQLRAKITGGPIKQAEQRALEVALNNRFPQGSEVLDHTTFYFDGKPTSCGDIRPRGSGTIRRYLYRNDFAMAEGDLPDDQFAEFWLICVAAGRYL